MKHPGNYKIKINSPEQSLYVQTLLHKLGYSWGGGNKLGSYTDKAHLYVYDDGSLLFGDTPSYYNYHENLELDPDTLEKPKNLVKVGKHYIQLSDKSFQQLRG